MNKKEENQEGVASEGAGSQKYVKSPFLKRRVF